MNPLHTSATFRFGPIWIAALAALLLGALAAGVMFVTSSDRAQNKLAAATPSPSASAAPVPEEELAAAPVASVTPFRCSASRISFAGATGAANVNAVRTGTHAGYDRLVVQFAGRQPGSIEITPQATASFLGAPSGQATRVAGTLGVKVLLKVADMHSAYTGSRDFKTGYVGLREARVIEDFEGYVSLGLGVDGGNCYRAFVLQSPTRLVVDIQTS
jgi:hypothetical protein